MRKPFIAVVASILLSGCSLFLGGEYTYLLLSQDYSVPSALPAASSYEQIQRDWTREGIFGLDGTLKVTLEDPALTSAYISWYADRSHLAPEGLLSQRWDNLYAGNRLPFEVSVTLAKRFYSKKQLDLSHWKISLRDDQGQQFKPAEIGAMDIAESDDTWQADFRLFFDRVDFQGRPLYPRTRYLELSIETPLEHLTYRWRFRPRANG